MSECVEFALRRCGLRHSLTLKPEQLKSLEVVLAGSHVITVLPTGFRKSLIYQLLPFAFDLQTDSSSSCAEFFLTFFSFGGTNLCIPWPRTSNYRRVHAREITRLCPLALGQGTARVCTMIYVCKAES